MQGVDAPAFSEDGALEVEVIEQIGELAVELRCDINQASWIGDFFGAVAGSASDASGVGQGVEVFQGRLESSWTLEAVARFLEQRDPEERLVLGQPLVLCEVERQRGEIACSRGVVEHEPLGL